MSQEGRTFRKDNIDGGRGEKAVSKKNLVMEVWVVQRSAATVCTGGKM